jgi:hypothetical protein
MYSIYSYAPSNGTAAGQEEDDTFNGYGSSCYSYSDSTSPPPHAPTYQTAVDDEAYLKEAEAGIELIDSVSGHGDMISFYDSIRSYAINKY